MFPITVIFITVAIGVAIIAEVLVAYQKYQMKKQFLKELDEGVKKQKKDNELLV